MNMTPCPALRPGMHQAEAASALGVSARTLRRWGKLGFGPRPTGDGNRLLYAPADIEAFMAGVR